MAAQKRRCEQCKVDVLERCYPRHVRSKKHARNRLTCANCSELFSNEDELRRHEARAHPVAPMHYSYFCLHCEVPIRRRSDVDGHVRGKSGAHAIVEKETVLYRILRRRRAGADLPPADAPGDDCDSLLSDRPLSYEDPPTQWHP